MNLADVICFLLDEPPEVRAHIVKTTDKLTGHTKLLEACKETADALRPCLFSVGGEPISWIAEFDDQERKRLFAAIADADK